MMEGKKGEGGRRMEGKKGEGGRGRTGKEGGGRRGENRLIGVSKGVIAQVSTHVGLTCGQHKVATCEGFTKKQPTETGADNFM